MLIIYVIVLSAKNKMQKRASCFYKNQKCRHLEIGKKKFQLIHFRNCYFFIYVFFSEKASVFHRSIPYGNHSGEIVARNNLVEDSYGAFELYSFLLSRIGACSPLLKVY